MILAKSKGRNFFINLNKILPKSLDFSQLYRETFDLSQNFGTPHIEAPTILQLQVIPFGANMGIQGIPPSKVPPPNIFLRKFSIRLKLFKGIKQYANKPSWSI